LRWRCGGARVGQTGFSSVSSARLPADVYEASREACVDWSRNGLRFSPTGRRCFAWTHTSAFASSMDKVYDVPLPDIRASSEPEVVLRGKHLAHSLGACAASECHGADLAGGK